ncbi:MAG: hypothetical protein M3N52_13755, partial [Actinomycetota bacterium]|nr:hypothetical protein [Actinomycetota bacterium]
ATPAWSRNAQRSTTGKATRASGVAIAAVCPHGLRGGSAWLDQAGVDARAEPAVAYDYPSEVQEAAEAPIPWTRAGS